MGFGRKKIFDADIAAIQSKEMEVFKKYLQVVLSNVPAWLKGKVDKPFVEMEFLDETPVLDCVHKIKSRQLLTNNTDNLQDHENEPGN